MSTSMRFTTSDLELLPDIDGVRYEIIDGELHVSRTPDWQHGYVCGRIGTALQNWSLATDAGDMIPAAGVIFAPDDNVIPDLVWISRGRFPHVWDGSGHMRVAPDLAVEVLSPGAENGRRDRELKLKLYSVRGVQEYWIVDWRLHTIEVYRREQAALRLVETLGDQDTLTSPLLPGFACPLAGIWSPPFLTAPQP